MSLLPRFLARALDFGRLRDPEWLDRVVASQTDPSLKSPLGDALPGFPPAQLQANTTGQSGRGALVQAFHFYQDVLAGAEVCKLDWRDARVLDFGTGWGRIARLFLREVRLDRLYGIDVDPDLVKLSAELFRSQNFTTCRPSPPTDFAPATFDAVTAYSVFSHLAPPVADAWFEEFARIVKPGGIVAFTTRDITFLDYIASLSPTPDLAEYQAGLVRLFPDHAVPRAAYARGEFVFGTSQSVSGGGPRNESFYGEAFIPEAYVRTRWASRFEVVANRFDTARYDQRGFVLRRR